jgi:hypothetical protein
MSGFPLLAAMYWLVRALRGLPLIGCFDGSSGSKLILKY